NAALLPVRNWRRADHLRTNVRGTENVLAAAVAAGVRRIVHVSSVSAYAGRAPIPVSEDHPLLGEDAGRLTPAYGLSKALAERRAWQLAREHRLALTTLRPCLIYGAWDTNFMPIFVALAKLPIAVMPACTWLPMVYAGDVAEAVALALEKPVAIGRAYNVAGEDMSVWRFFRAWREAGGRSARLGLPVPFPYRRYYDTTRARTELGWRSRPVDEALRETLALDPRPWRR
ncbi:MAG: NAD(P)-dependent oxidoreductase, partial [Deltaproteobacteria bacterium]